jgi:hypothetical protein
MSLRKQVSLEHEVYEKARAVHLLTGETFSRVADMALAALLDQRPDLKRRVEELQRTLAA